MPKHIRILFLIQAIVLFALGLGWLMMLDLKAIVIHCSDMERLFMPICVALLLAFVMGSFLAFHSRAWREVELFIRIKIAFCASTILALAVVMLFHGGSTPIWISILACVGTGGVWSGIYFKHSKEVRGPGINIKEFR